MSLQSHCEVIWIEKTRVEVTSKFRSYAKQLFEKTVPVTPNSEALSSARPRTEDGYPRVHTSVYMYIHALEGRGWGLRLVFSTFLCVLAYLGYHPSHQDDDLGN